MISKLTENDIFFNNVDLDKLMEHQAAAGIFLWSWWRPKQSQKYNVVFFIQ